MVFHLLGLLFPVLHIKCRFTQGWPVGQLVELLRLRKRLLYCLGATSERLALTFLYRSCFAGCASENRCEKGCKGFLIFILELSFHNNILAFCLLAWLQHHSIYKGAGPGFGSPGSTRNLWVIYFWWNNQEIWPKWNWLCKSCGASAGSSILKGTLEP